MLCIVLIVFVILPYTIISIKSTFALFLLPSKTSAELRFSLSEDCKLRKLIKFCSGILLYFKIETAIKLEIIIVSCVKDKKNMYKRIY